MFRYDFISDEMVKYRITKLGYFRILVFYFLNDVKHT